MYIMTANGWALIHVEGCRPVTPTSVILNPWHPNYDRLKDPQFAPKLISDDPLDIASLYA